MTRGTDPEGVHEPMDGAFPRVTFGVIVLNGEPFTRYCLRSVYPFAHEIIVVEGGHEDTRGVSTPDGHSTDGTLEVLYRFKAEEDPLNKVQIVTRDGPWPKTDELGYHRTAQSRAYAERATGDYLWQVDIDEFYLPGDMSAVLEMLKEDPGITAVSFNERYSFWGGLDYVIDGWKRRRGKLAHRLFKWGPGYRYATHEPPTVYNEHGENLRDVHYVSGDAMARRGVHMYHYTQVFPRQVREKVLIYRDEKPAECLQMQEWAESSFFRLDHPYRVERHYWLPSWLERFTGEHPPEVLHMMADIESGRISEELRPRDDVERLLTSRRYAVGRTVLAALEPVDRAWQWVRHQFVRAGRGPRKIARWRHLRRVGTSLPRTQDIADAVVPTGSAFGTLAAASRADAVYRIPLSTGQLVDASLEGPEITDFCLYLFGPDATGAQPGRALAANVVRPYPKRLTFRAVTAGDHYMLAHAYMGEGPYTIRWSVRP